MSSFYKVESAYMHENVGADGTHMIIRMNEAGASVPVAIEQGAASRSRPPRFSCRRWIGSLVAVAAIAVLALAGCNDSSNGGGNGNGGDTTAPTVSAQFISAVESTATLELTVDEPGTLFWVAYTDGTAPANASALIADAGKAKNAPIFANSGRNGQEISAAGTVSVSITGIVAGTNYDFYAVFRDTAGNVSAISAKLDVSVLSVSGLAATVVESTATIELTVNGPGTLFWVAYADGSPAPADASALIADAGKAKIAPIFANSGRNGQEISAAGTTSVSVSIADLAAGANYDFYAVFRDADDNVSAVSPKLDVSIVLSVSGLTATSVGATATIELTADGPGTLFWVVYADGSSAPANALALIADAGKAKNALILANSGSGGQVISAAGTVSVSITNLPVGTGYDFYAVVRDADGNISVISPKVEVSIALSVSGLTATVIEATATIGLTVNKPGTLIWVAYVDGTAPADASALIADAAKAKNAPIFANSGSVGEEISTAGTTVPISITGLVAGTKYDFYAIVRDAANNVSAVSPKLDVNTVLSVSGLTAAVAGATATIGLTTDDSRTLFWVAYADGTVPANNPLALIADAGRAKNTPIVANSGNSGQAILAAGATSVSITSGLAPGTSYDFYATVRDADGNVSAISPKLDFSTVLSVSGLTAIVTSTTSVDLAWTNPNPTTDDLQHIAVTWAIVGDGSSSPGTYKLSSPTEGGSANYAVTGLQPSSTYRFSVVSVDNANNSSLAVIIDETPRVDSDNDTLIDIRNLNMLSNVRHNLAGAFYTETAGATTGLQCGASGATACTGYELVRSLDFATAGDYASGIVDNAWRPTANADGSGAVVAPASALNPGWMPIGMTFTDVFTAIFDGNGNSISNLYIRRLSNAGLFHGLSGTVRNLGVVEGAVYGSDWVGILAARTNAGSTIVASYATGSANVVGVAVSTAVGGLVGSNAGGTIIASYATAVITGHANIDRAGGLVGAMLSGVIIASYATGDVSTLAKNDAVGGLVARFDSRQGVVASYATGNVSGGLGGEVGVVGDTVDALSISAGSLASYGFGTVTGAETFRMDSPRPSGIAAGSGKVGARMLTLTTPASTAAGARWNAVANNTLGAWDFGTSSQIPAVKYADYDGTGTVYNCNQFPAGACGTLIPGQR